LLVLKHDDSLNILNLIDFVSKWFIEIGANGREFETRNPQKTSAKQTSINNSVNQNSDLFCRNISVKHRSYFYLKLYSLIYYLTLN